MIDQQNIDKKATALQTEVESMEFVSVIQNEDELNQAVEMLGDIKKKMKEIEKTRKEFTAPLLEHKKVIDNKFKNIKDPLEKNEKILKKIILDYQKKKEEEALEQLKLQQEAQAKAQAEADKQAMAEAAERGCMTGPPPSVPVPGTETAIEEPKQTVRTGATTASFKKVWKFEITDPTLIPGKYWMINEKQINEDIRKGTREIPGVKIFQENQLAVR